jgi:hypothetical protein
MESQSKSDGSSQRQEELSQASSFPLSKDDSGIFCPGENEAFANQNSPAEDWRELARRIQDESDPAVMVELVQQLISKLDEEKLQRNRHSRK